MTTREFIDICRLPVIHYIIGTICLLILFSRLEQLFQLDENTDVNDRKHKVYRQRFGSLVKRGFLLMMTDDD